MNTPLSQDPMQQLAAMREGVNYELAIKVRNFSFVARPLTIAEQNQALYESQTEISKLPEFGRDIFAESAIIAKAYLSRASKPYGVSKDTQPGISDYIMDRATPEELRSMYKQYCAIVDKCNPDLEKIPTEELVLFANELKKKNEGAEFALSEKSFNFLVSLSLHLLKESTSSQTGN